MSQPAEKVGNAKVISHEEILETVHNGPRRAKGGL